MLVQIQYNIVLLGIVDVYIYLITNPSLYTGKSLCITN